MPVNYAYVWSDGVAGNYRSNLFAGTYSITATNDDGCSQIFSLTVDNECSCLQAQVESLDIENAHCGNSDGSATIYLLGNEADYTYTWLPDLGAPNGAGNSRTALPVGHYVVTMTYLGNPDCVEQVEFDIADDCSPCHLELSGVPADLTVDLSLAEVIPPPADVTAFDTCEGNIPVNFEETTTAGDCVQYQIIRTWTATNAADSTVSGVQTITVIDAGIVNEFTVIPDSCEQGKGAIIFTHDSYSYEWNDGGSGAARNDLTAGSYLITITNNLGCVEVITIVVENNCACIPAEIASIDITNADCGTQNGSATINLTGNEADYSYTWLPNFGASNATGNSRTNLPTGHYVVFMTYLNNLACVEKAEFDVLDGCPPCGPIFDVDYLTVEVSSDPATACLPVPFGVSQNHDIYVNGVPYAGSLEQCNGQTVIFYSYAIVPGTGQSGPYQIAWNFNGTTLNVVVNNMDELVAAMNVADPGGFWYHDPASLGFSTANISGNYGNMTIVHVPTGITAYIQPNFSNSSLGTLFTLPAGTSQIVFINPTSGCSDTIDANLNMFQPHPGIFEEELVVTSVNCDHETPGYCLGIPFTELYQYSFTVNGEVYAGDFGMCSYVASHFYTYVSLPGLGSSGPYKLENWSVNGQAHTATFQDLEELVSWMNQWDLTGEWVLDSAAMTIRGGTSMSTYSNLQITQLSSGAAAILELNTSYTPGTAYMDLPDGESTVIATRLSDGEQDTLLVKIACLTPDYYKDVIEVGQVDTVCLSLDELFGDVASVRNICEEGFGAAASMKLLSEINCVKYTGEYVGLSNACYIICDEYGICDTTYIEITVRENSTSTLLPDTLYTGLEQTVTGQVLSNDQLEGDLLSVKVKTKPQHGTAKVNADGSISYTPDPEYCNENSQPDHFFYEVCTTDGCQTAMVYVFVSCGDLVIYTGFSPNGDGVNDFFRIDGLQRYPNHELTVFNRWGNRVFQTKDYKNDWNGSWNRQPLPDGTYFYIFDDGEGKTHAGYVQIRR